MFQYIIKRILIFIPTIIGISLITFIISINAPGDPVQQMIGSTQGGEGQLAGKLATEKEYRKMRHKLGLDLPIFYFSFNSLADCDTLYQIPKRKHRETLSRLIHKHGNWEYIEDYYHSVKQLDLTLYKVKSDSTTAGAIIKVRNLVSELFVTHKEARIQQIFDELRSIFHQTMQQANVSMQSKEEHKEYDELMQANLVTFSDVKQIFEKTHNSYQSILKNATPWKKYVPVITFYGLQNQYHNWITNFIQGDFGISYQDMRPVSSVVWDALKWTLILSFSAIFITYIIAVPLGVQSAMKKGGAKDQVISTILFALYSLPNFWVATLLIIFFGGGDFFDWFPTHGVGDAAADAPFIERFLNTAYYFTLPLICLTYPTFAFLGRQMRGGMLDVLNQDYIRTARAKGLPEKSVIWKHTFRNSLLPIITLFGNVFPFVIVGSFVIEYIFSIHGMGLLTYQAIIARNYPVVLTVVMMASVLTLVGYLVADILYAVVDPRITYSKKAG